MGMFCGNVLWECSVEMFCGNVTKFCRNVLWKSYLWKFSGNLFWKRCEGSVGIFCEKALWESFLEMFCGNFLQKCCVGIFCWNILWKIIMIFSDFSRRFFANFWWQFLQKAFERSKTFCENMIFISLWKRVHLLHTY